MAVAPWLSVTVTVTLTGLAITEGGVQSAWLKLKSGACTGEARTPSGALQEYADSTALPLVSRALR
jgi:hypothetical protein